LMFRNRALECIGSCVDDLSTFFVPMVQHETKLI
jgi:hypothetical protein